MAKSIFEYNPTFKQAAEVVRFAIEKASQQHVDIFDKCWYEGHFKMGSKPHLLSDFKTLLGKKHITIAASTINDHSAEPLRLNRGFKEVEQKMFTHAHAYKHDSDDIRELIMATQMAEKNADVQAVNYIRDYLMEVMNAAVSGCKARLDVIILGALSNKGFFTFTQQNDPQSPFVGQTLDFGMPSANCAEVGAGNEWTEANLAKVDVLKDLDDVLNRTRTTIKKIYTDRDTANFMRRTKALRELVCPVNYSGQSAQPVTLGMMNEWLSANGYPTVEVIERRVAIQNGDGLAEINPWKAGQLLFVPSDDFGTIETRLSDAELGMRSEGVKYANYGRIEVRQLTLGEKENTSYTEITKASITAAPAIDAIDQMLTLDTTK